MWLAAVVVAIIAGWGFIEVQTRAQPLAAVTAITVTGNAAGLANLGSVDAAALDRQRFATQFRPIHARIEQNVAETGLLVASYQSGSIDKAELQRRLAAVLSEYRDAAGQLDALSAPAEVRPAVQAYREAVAALSQAGVELSKAYDDGDEGRVSAALALSLRATAQLHDVSDIAPGSSARAS